MNATQGSTDMSFWKCCVAATLLLVSLFSAAQTEPVDYPKANVSFGDFKSLVSEVERHRRERLISLDTFLEMSREPGVVILDARSMRRFERLHLDGARHLSFSDFTQAALGEVIPTLDTTVLIYCNNNFVGNQEDFPTKVALPISIRGSAGDSDDTPTEQPEMQPLMMALNIPTYVSLYGYGYRNVYELNELVDVEDSRLNLAGSTVYPSMRTGHQVVTDP